MKEIEFSFNEEQLPNIAQIVKSLIEEDNDPRSNNYIRKLERPEIKWYRIILFLLAPVVVFFIISYCLFLLKSDIITSLLTFFIPLIAYHLFFLKKSMICCIHIYQRYAPDSVRNNCRFEPSCSQYFIMSLEKFGVIKGTIKGINRLKRCNVKNGGYDYP